MTVTDVPIMAAVAEQAPTLGDLIATSFHDLAVSRWLVEDPAERQAAQAGQFTLLVSHALAYGQVHTTADESAVAVWLPHDEHHEVPEIPGYDKLLAEICGEHVGRFADLDAAMDDHHPGEPHWYLAFLAVSPGRQGHGVGSALLEHQHRRLDELGIPAFLHSADLRSRALYLRHGYQPHGEPFPVGPGAPSMYPLWRAPSSR